MTRATDAARSRCNMCAAHYCSVHSPRAAHFCPADVDFSGRPLTPEAEVEARSNRKGPALLPSTVKPNALQRRKGQPPRRAKWLPVAECSYWLGDKNDCGGGLVGCTICSLPVCINHMLEHLGDHKDCTIDGVFYENGGGGKRGISSSKSCHQQVAVGARASDGASEFTDHCVTT